MTDFPFHMCKVDTDWEMGMLSLHFKFQDAFCEDDGEELEALLAKVVAVGNSAPHICGYNIGTSNIVWHFERASTRMAANSAYCFNLYFKSGLQMTEEVIGAPVVVELDYPFQPNRSVFDFKSPF